MYLTISHLAAILAASGFAFFMAGYHWRNIRADIAIRRLQSLHAENIRRAEVDGFRKGVTSQMMVETRNSALNS